MLKHAKKSNLIREFVYTMVKTESSLSRSYKKLATKHVIRSRSNAFLTEGVSTAQRIYVGYILPPDRSTQMIEK